MIKKFAVLLAVLLAATSVGATNISSQSSTSQYIAPTAPTSIPVYDTAWQMFVLADPADADEYFRTLRDFGFTGAWSALAHHSPATIAHPFFGGGTVANFDARGNIVFTPEYIAHVREILDAADRYGMKIGVVAAWQNLYLPGGRSDDGHPVSDTVRGRLTTANSYNYGVQIVEAFGDHPAVSAWVFGGDAGSNNTEANIQVWRNMADGVRDAGSTIDITYHTPSAFFDQLNYAGEEWLDFISPETGHNTTPAEIQEQLIEVGEAYQLPVWQGEPRYFNLNFDWVVERFRNPQVADVEADAIAARNAGAAGYVYGDAGRWNWCGGFGDSTPCDRHNISASFGAGERAVINVFRGQRPAPAPTPTLPPAPRYDDPGLASSLGQATCAFENHPVATRCGPNSRQLGHLTPVTGSFLPR